MYNSLPIPEFLPWILLLLSIAGFTYAETDFELLLSFLCLGVALATL